MSRRAAILLFAVLVPCSAAAGGPVADGVVAVVGRVPILVSDLRLAQAVRLAEPVPDRTRWGERLLDARIRLELEYQDLTGGGTMRPSVNTEPVLERLVAAGGGPEVLERRLAAAGLTMEDVRDLALRLATVENAVQTRFRRGIRVRPEEVEAAYREALVPEVTRRGGTPPAMNEVRDDLRRLVEERRLNQRLERWLEQARERFPVVRYRAWAAEPEP